MALEDAAVLETACGTFQRKQASATYEHLWGGRAPSKYIRSEYKAISASTVVRPMQQWFRDLMSPIFLKLFANPKASKWMYSYRVDRETPVVTNTGPCFHWDAGNTKPGEADKVKSTRGMVARSPLPWWFKETSWFVGAIPFSTSISFRTKSTTRFFRHEDCPHT